MSSWTPTVGDDRVPKFIAIVEALQRDIGGGRLSPGTRLPPYRELALSLRISPGTVSKAYAEAERRKLVRGEVGRGTFVGPEPASPTPEQGSPVLRDVVPAIIDISFNAPPLVSHNIILAEALAKLTRQAAPELHSRYLPYVSHPQHSEAATGWLARHGVAAEDGGIVLTNGAQHAMAVSFSCIARPGDIVFTDRLTYPGMIALAGHLNLVLEPVDGDGEGLLPERLDEAAGRRPGRAIYVMPTLQNPTGRTMGVERRRAIAGVAVRHGLFVVEDDIYGLLSRSTLPPLRDFAPRLTFYLTGLSKSLVPGLRVGFLLPPRDKVAEVNAAMRATGWTAAPLMVDVAAKMILDGTADRLADQNRHEALSRQQLAHVVLGRWLPGAPEACYHAWLPLPDGWDAEGFSASARMAGVAVTPTAGVLVGAGDPGGVRLCLGAARSPHILDIALRRLDAILVGGQRRGLAGLI